MTRRDSLGRLRAEGDRHAVRFERTFAADRTDVWAALTQPDRLAAWLADSVSLDARRGGDVRLRWGDNVVEGVVLACEPPRLLEYTWREAHEESVVRYELTARQGETVLVVDHRRLAGVSPGDFAAGWHTHLDMLTAHLDGRALDFWPRFSELRTAYREGAALA